MYVVGKGNDIMGPGTSLVQRIDWTPLQERQLSSGFGLRGMGCGGRGMGCACKGGLGLFDSMDFSTWGASEWAIVLVGGYMVISTIFTTKRAASRVRAIPGERRQKRAAALRREASELSKRKGLFA
jgi:hypothetical protein